MRQTPYNFIGDVKAENTTVVPPAPPSPPATETPAPDTAAANKPAVPAGNWFERNKTLLIIAAVAALLIFFWKFKIVLKTPPVPVP